MIQTICGIRSFRRFTNVCALVPGTEASEMTTGQSLLAWPHGIGVVEWLREGARGRTLSPGQGSEEAFRRDADRAVLPVKSRLTAEKRVSIVGSVDKNSAGYW